MHNQLSGKIKNRIRLTRKYMLAGFAVLLVSGCAELTKVLQQMDIKKPTVSVADVKMTGLSFDHTDLNFKIQIDNPNGVNISLAGFDYNFEINQKSFSSGTQDRPIDIAARGQSQFDFPLTLKFTDVAQTIGDLLTRDSAAYKIDLGLLFDLPVLGKQNIPLSYDGHFPIPKLPAIRVHSLKLDNIGLTGAQLSLDLIVDNPNAFALDLAGLDYTFSVNGTRWVSGLQKSVNAIAKNQQGRVTIPVSLDFLSMGRSVYQMLNGNADLDYNLEGSVNVGSGLPLLGTQKMPFSQSGKIDLQK